MPFNNSWYIYIVRCNDGTLYTGITKNLDKRIDEHNSGNGGAKYTRFRRPVRLVYTEQVESRSDAAKREYQLKKMPLTKKNELIIAPAGKNSMKNDKDKNG
jgi:putative endonuclease